MKAYPEEEHQKETDGFLHTVLNIEFPYNGSTDILTVSPGCV